jgi:polyisoprenoid-binding protein YceI
MSRRTKIAGAVVVVLLLLVGGAVWWWLSDDPPEELSVDDVVGDEPAGSDDSGATEAGDLDGTWSVVEGAESQAGLRISEQLANGLADHEAVGRTPNVTGEVVVAGTEVTTGSFTVDLTALEWSDSPPGLSVGNRSNAIRGQGLETDTYPDGTFELTAPAEVDQLPAAGETATLDVTGDLTLHGVTNEVTFSVDVARDGDRLVVGTTEPVTVALADYGIDPPQSPVVASVADEGSFEFVVVLAQAS